MRKIIPFLLILFVLSHSKTVAADFNGDGTADIAIFRPSTGLWAIRGVSRCYFGMAGDNPAPSDCNGDGSADIVIFRSTTGLWAIRNISRLYFGTVGDISLSTGGINYNPNLFDVDPISGYVRIGWGSQSSGLEVGKAAMSGQHAIGHDVIFHGSDYYGGDTRLIWDNDRAALRIGRMLMESTWNEWTPGFNSISAGYDTNARGGNSAAFGYRCWSTGSPSFAVGECAGATGRCSFSSGLWAIAEGDHSTAIGGESVGSYEDYGIAIGSRVASSADYSIAIGKGCVEYPHPKSLTNNIPDSLMIGFNTSTDPAFFVDSSSVGIGITTPARKLHVNAVMRLEPISTAPDNPGEGDLYYDSSTHKLKCYDGSSWQDCF